MKGLSTEDVAIIQNNILYKKIILKVFGNLVKNDYLCTNKNEQLKSGAHHDKNCTQDMMKQPMYKVGDCVVAKNGIYSDCGKITEITQSNGTKKRWLYRVGFNYYFTTDIKKKLEVQHTPNEYWTMLREVNRQIEKEVYEIIMRNGKWVGDDMVVDNLIDQDGFGLIVKDNNFKVRTIQRILISRPKQCQVQGHVLYYDTDGKQVSMLSDDNIWSIYSHLFRLYEDA